MFSGKRLKIIMLEFSSVIFLIPIVAVIYSRIAVEKYQFIGGGSVCKMGTVATWILILLLSSMLVEGMILNMVEKAGKIQRKVCSKCFFDFFQNVPKLFINRELTTHLLVTLS